MEKGIRHILLFHTGQKKSNLNLLTYGFCVNVNVYNLDLHFGELTLQESYVFITFVLAVMFA